MNKKMFCFEVKLSTLKLEVVFFVFWDNFCDEEMNNLNQINVNHFERESKIVKQGECKKVFEKTGPLKVK